MITAGRNAQGEPVQTWERTLFFPRGVRRRYVSTMLPNPGAPGVIELLGPGQRWAETAEVRFAPPNVLQFESVESVLRLGLLRLRMPRRLWITAHVVQTADLANPGRSRVELQLVHGLLGPIFGYEGEFRLRRVRPRAGCGAGDPGCCASSV